MGVLVIVGDGDNPGVCVGVFVRVIVGVIVGVCVGVGVFDVAVGVKPGQAVPVGVIVGVIDGVKLIVGVLLGVCDGVTGNGILYLLDYIKSSFSRTTTIRKYIHTTICKTTSNKYMVVIVIWVWLSF